MYKKFNIETDKDLILLNYYIEQNMKKTIIELTIKDVEKILNVNRSKAYRCIKKLEELEIIKIIEKSKSKSKKTEYQYLLKNNSTGRSGKGTKKEIPEHLSEYADIYVNKMGKVDHSKIIDILKIKDIEKIEIKLFESIIEDSKLNAIKNPHNYAKTSILKTIEDNIFTLQDRKKSQNIYLNPLKNTAKNYTDNSEQEDWEEITKLASRY